MLVRLVAVVAFCFFLLWFYCTRKCDVIETHETNARIIGILVVCGLLSVWLFVYGLASLWNYITSGQSLWIMVLTVPFTLPLILIPYCYFTLERSFKRRYNLESECFKTAVRTKWSTLVTELSQKLGLRESPSIAVVTSKNGSPVVFGRTIGHTFLAIPSDFEQMVESASHNNSEIADGLTRFILLHELAHIRNGDVVFTSWLECFLRVFRYLGSLLVLCLLFERLLMANNLASGGTIVLFTVSYLTLLLLARSFRRLRELLADARASLCMDKLLVAKLVGSKGNEIITPFESAIVMCTVLSDLQTANRTCVKTNLLQTMVSKLVYLPYAVQKCVRRAVRKAIGGGIQEVKARATALRLERYVGTKSSLPTVSAAFVNGLVGVLALVLPLSIIVVTKPLSDVLNLGKAQNNVLFLTGWSALLYIAYIYSLPLRNSAGVSVQTGSYFMGLAFRYCAGALTGALFFVLLTLCSSKTWNQIPAYFKGITISLAFYLVAFLLSCIFSFFLRFEDYFASFCRHKEALLMHVMSLPAGLFFGGVFLVIAWRVGWFVTILGVVVGVVISFLLCAIFPTQGHPVDRWIRFSFSVFRKSSTGRIFEKNMLWIVNLHVFVLFVVPSGFATFILSRFLGENHVFIPKGPGSWILLCWACFIVLIALPLIYYLGKKYTLPLLFLVLRTGQLLGESLLLFCHRPVFDVREKMRLILSIAENEKGGFFVTTRGKPYVCMDSTWSGLLCFSTLGFEPAYKSEHIKWILQCENRDGGFGVLPGSSSRLSSTFYALTSISIMNSLQAIDPGKHAVWIKKWQRQDGSFHGPYSGWEALTDTYFAVGSLALLGETDSLDPEHYATWAMNDWRKGSPTHERTYYLTKILEWLGQMSEERAVEIDRKYLIPCAPVMTQLLIEKHPGPTFYYLSCAKAVKGLSFVKEEMGQFTERVVTGFGAFVQHSAEILIPDSLKGT